MHFSLSQKTGMGRHQSSPESGFAVSLSLSAFSIVTRTKMAASAMLSLCLIHNVTQMNVAKCKHEPLIMVDINFNIYYDLFFSSSVC